jgi:hypothetical protein
MRAFAGVMLVTTEISVRSDPANVASSPQAAVFSGILMSFSEKEKGFETEFTVQT